MRTKAVPMPEKIGEEAGKLLKNKWVLYGGIGVLVLGVGYYVLTNAGSAQASTPITNSGSPVAYPGAGGAPSSSGIPSSSDNSTLADAINANAASQNAQNQISLAGINAAYNTAIAADQTTLGVTNIAGQVANYAASTNVLDTFLNNTTGGVISLGGTVSPTALGGVDVALFSANNKGVNDYTDILHKIAGGAFPNTNSPSSFGGGGVTFGTPTPAPMPITSPKPPTLGGDIAKTKLITVH